MKKIALAIAILIGSMGVVHAQSNYCTKYSELAASIQMERIGGMSRQEMLEAVDEVDMYPERREDSIQLINSIYENTSIFNLPEEVAILALGVCVRSGN